MYKEKTIVTVVPAHNEARHIGGVIKTMPDFVDYLIVVNSSRDATAESYDYAKGTRFIAGQSLALMPHKQYISVLRIK